MSRKMDSKIVPIGMLEEIYEYLTDLRGEWKTRAAYMSYGKLERLRSAIQAVGLLLESHDYDFDDDEFDDFAQDDPEPDIFDVDEADHDRVVYKKEIDPDRFGPLHPLAVIGRGACDVCGQMADVWSFSDNEWQNDGVAVCKICLFDLAIRLMKQGRCSCTANQKTCIK